MHGSRHGTPRLHDGGMQRLAAAAEAVSEVFSYDLTVLCGVENLELVKLALDAVSRPVQGGVRFGLPTDWSCSSSDQSL